MKVSRNNKLQSQTTKDTRDEKNQFQNRKQLHVKYFNIRNEMIQSSGKTRKQHVAIKNKQTGLNYRLNTTLRNEK